MSELTALITHYKTIANVPVSALRTIPCAQMRALSEDDRVQIASMVAQDVRAKGFPFYDLEFNEIRRAVGALFGFSPKTLDLGNGLLEQNMLGLNVANFYHSEMWSAHCRNARSPMDIFNDFPALVGAIYKRIGLSETPLADYNIRKSLKALGAQSVSNFRPTIAQWVYKTHAGRGASVLDPCAGYGGRLLGAWTSEMKHYVGVDPCSSTQVGNHNLAEGLTVATVQINEARLLENYGFMDTRLECVPFEDFESREKFDLVFTSPPYYNVEKYSNEPTQSYLRYPEYPFWVDGFLKPLIQKSWDFLHSEGVFALNVAGKDLVADTLRIAKSVFGDPIETYQMRLSKIFGKGDKFVTTHKTEPIFVWKKE